MERKSLSEKIIRNSFFTITGYFWWTLVAIFLTPYIMSHIGIVRYGIWAIMGVIVGYAGILDLGIGIASVKYVPEFYAKKDYGKINQVFNTTVVFYLIFTGLITLFAIFFINPILTFFKIPENFHSEVIFVFIVGVIIFGASNTLNAFEGILHGLQRMDLSNKVEIAISIPHIIGTFFFLENGYGLAGLMINSAIITGLKGIINAVIAFRLLPELRCNPLLFSRGMFRELFKYGIKAQVTRLEKISTFQTDKLLISHFLNMSLVGFYQLGSLIVDKVRWLFSFLPFVVIPVASELDAYRDRKGLYDLYYRGTKYLAISAMPLFIFIFLTAPLIMLVWMGKGYENAVLVIRIFTPCYLINFLTGVASAIVLGVGKPELQMKASLVQLTFNIVLGIILIIKFGFVGTLTATFISLSLGSIWFVTMFHRYMNYPLFQFAKAILLKPLIACILPAVVISGLNYSIIFPPGRLINFCILASDTILFIAFYAFTLLKIGYLDEYDIFLGKKYADAIRNFVKSSGTRKD